MTKRLLLTLPALILAINLPAAFAQPGAGRPFGARDPRTCASRKAGLSAAQAKQYLICDLEVVLNANGERPQLSLVTDVTVELGKGRPFNMQSDSFGFATTNGIDPSQTVYPIRGSFNQWNCGKLGVLGVETGKSCSKWPGPPTSGICFKNSFGDWHCIMTGLQYPTMERFPPPTGQ